MAGSSTSEQVVRVGRFLARTIAEGPGSRSALWVQGCGIRCPGCFNPQFWGERGGTEATVEELLARVPEDVEGVTLLGGEPFEQAAPLAAFAAAVQARGQSVMTFSGFTLDELGERAARVAGTAELLAHTDLLVDGPFLEDQLDHSRPWVGSRNQGIRALTSRYASHADDWSAHPDRVEVTIGPDGSVALNGWADVDALDLLLTGVGGARSRAAGRRRTR